jgi:hypothetical protein
VSIGWFIECLTDGISEKPQLLDYGLRLCSFNKFRRERKHQLAAILAPAARTVAVPASVSRSPSPPNARGIGAPTSTRFFLLHLNPHDSARDQHQSKNKCCDDCPFARRFVHRCRRLNASPVRPIPCWRSPKSGPPERPALLPSSSML